MPDTTETITRRRRILVGAAVALTVVAVAGCASSGDKKSDAAKDHLKRAAATKPAAPSSTTEAPAPTTTAPAAPACTNAAAQAVIGSASTVTGVACAGNYLSGTANYNTSGVASGFMLQNVNGQWQQVTGQALTDLCATNGLPSVLEQGCYDN